MRLDHLLSTESSGHGSCPVCAPCAWNGSTVPCGDAGVEEIGGLDGPVPSGSGMGVLLGSRTATPGLVSRRGLSAPRDRRRVGSRAVGSAGAWWFENWIVDASGRTPLLVFSCSVISMTPAGFLLLLVVGFCLIVL